MSDAHRVHARHGRHTRGGGSGRVVVAIGAVLATLAVGLVGGWAMAPSGASDTAAAEPPAAPVPASSQEQLPSRPVMIGRVTRVVSGEEVVARVAATDMTVRILGIDTPDPMTTTNSGAAECGSREALQYADAKLTGQMVTLVPDPTLAEFDERGRRLAYVVLRSQLSYTDAAIMEGIGRADTARPLWYADVFAREQRAAVADEVGIWGAPCNATV